MSPSSPKRYIAVIIVNYGTAELAAAGIDSVLARTQDDLPVEVHLVDNASPNGDAEALKRLHLERGWGPRVTLYLETENHGFGNGNNLVLKALADRKTPPWAVFLLNPDAQLDNDTIGTLARFLDAHPKAACVGAGIRKPDGTPVTAAFRFPGVLSEFARGASFGPISRLTGAWQVALSPDLAQTRVDWVAGAAVMIRFEALTQIGFFDPCFFLYYEEVDLMRRAGKAGWEIWYVPDAAAIHIEGAATGVRSNISDRPRRPAYWYRSWRMYFERSHGRLGALGVATAALAGAGLNRMLSLLPNRQPALADSYFSDHWGQVIRPLLGLSERRHD
jgi:GT2 family glycosyltransferase